jgi:hypothetical protein
MVVEIANISQSRIQKKRSPYGVQLVNRIANVRVRSKCWMDGWMDTLHSPTLGSNRKMWYAP